MEEKRKNGFIFIGIYVANPFLTTFFGGIFPADSFCFALTSRLGSCINNTWWCQWDHCIHECPHSSALPAVMTFQPWVWHCYLFQRLIIACLCLKIHAYDFKGFSFLLNVYERQPTPHCCFNSWLWKHIYIWIVCVYKGKYILELCKHPTFSHLIFAFVIC